MVKFSNTKKIAVSVYSQLYDEKQTQLNCILGKHKPEALPSL